MGKVLVQWYGQVVTGEIVERPKDGSILDSMVGVRIPVQGTQIVAMFHPSHVYNSWEELIENTKKNYNYPKEFPNQVEHVAPKNTLSPEVWQRLQEYKTAHWDHEHNHLKVEACDNFYEIYRMAVAQKNGVVVEAPTSVKPVATKPVEAAKLAKQSPIEHKKPTKTVKFVELSLFE